jgi:predicted protein tyrosine phosphatase
MPDYPTNLLFICSRNKIRSLSAEKLLTGVPGYRTASAATQPGARAVVTAGLLRWADIIFCMEKGHMQKLRERCSGDLAGKRIVTLHIPDEYEFMAEDLIDELRAKLAGHLEVPDSF